MRRHNHQETYRRIFNNGFAGAFALAAVGGVGVRRASAGKTRASRGPFPPAWGAGWGTCATWSAVRGSRVSVGARQTGGSGDRAGSRARTMVAIRWGADTAGE